MRDGKELLLATRPYTREHRPTSWWHVLTTALLLGTALGVAAYAPVAWWVRLGVSVVGGLLLTRMFVLFHDYEHGAILRGSRLARLIMDTFGLLFLCAPSIWRETHNHHHRHNAMIVEDPVGTFPLMTVEDYAVATPWRRFYYSMARNPLIIVFGFITVFFWQLTLWPLLTKPRQHWDCALAILVHGAALAGLAMWSLPAMVLGLVIPSAVGAALGAYLFYAQHNFPEVDLKIPDRWDYVHAAMKASSYLDTNPIMHWFTANIGYHHVHHLNAKIPFYRLPEAMAGLEETHRPAKTSLHPLEIYRCLRLKLWDSRQNKLVTFGEARRLIRSRSRQARSRASRLADAARTAGLGKVEPA